MRQILSLIFISSTLFFTSCGEREDVVTIHTELGDIVLILFNETPQHKKNFLELAKGNFYDSTTFHRVIDGFMIQGGDPNSKDNDPMNDGRGGPGYTVPAEFNDNITHIKGALAAARQGDQVNPEKASSGSQFYIVENDNGTHQLDDNYTVFGQTIAGFEVIETIAIQPKGRNNRPLKDIKMWMEVKKISRKKITKTYGYEFK
ncbi:MAG: peptidylprolyl isomerase [Bacteroidota bacterium]